MSVECVLVRNNKLFWYVGFDNASLNSFFHFWTLNYWTIDYSTIISLNYILL